MDEMFYVEGLLTEDALKQIDEVISRVSLDHVVNIDNVSSFERSTNEVWFARPIDWKIGMDFLRLRTAKNNVNLAVELVENKAYELKQTHYVAATPTILRYGVDAGIGLHDDGTGNKFTCLMVLNDDYEGGEFIIAGKVIPMKRGDCFIFKSSLIHCVSKVTKGVRYVFALYISEVKQ